MLLLAPLKSKNHKEESLSDDKISAPYLPAKGAGPGSVDPSRRVSKKPTRDAGYCLVCILFIITTIDSILLHCLSLVAS